MNALHTIQQKLKAPKNQYNSFGKYHYRNQEDILEAVKPLLSETKSTLTITDELVDIGGSLFVKSTASLVCEKESWNASAFAKHAVDKKGMDDAQITGSASSYARKYALNGLFLIDDTRDPDTKDNSKKEEPKQSEAPKSEPAKKGWLNPNTDNWTHTIKRMREGMSLEEVKKFFNISKANEVKLVDEAK